VPRPDGTAGKNPGIAGRTPARLPHVPALDGLRGAAVAAVLLFHGDELKGGFLGVDLFFVLSGFLITSLLLVEARRGRIDLARFWARRARRLLPALALLLGAVALYAVVFAAPDELAHIRADGVATTFYFANWHAVFATQSYWDLFAKPSPLAHAWSLAIEEQFYVLWPLVCAGIVAVRSRRRDPAPAVLAVSIVLTLASAAAMFVLYHPGDTNRAYFGTDTRAASILIGAALAAWLTWRGRPTTQRGWRWLQSTSLAGVAVLAFAWTRFDGTSATVYRGGFFVCALAAAAIIATITDPRPGAVRRVLACPPLVGLGIISYGVYLWHWPIYVVLDAARTGLNGWPLLALRVAGTLVVALVSYVVVERPIRHGAFSGATLRALTPAVTVAVVIALFASTGGVAAPPDQTAIRKPDRPEDVSGAVAAAPTAQRLLIVGNSVADLLGVGFKELKPDPPIVVLNGALASCIFPDGVTRLRSQAKNIIYSPTGCTKDWPTDVQQFRPNVSLLILGDFGDGDYERNGQWIHPCMPEFDDWYRDSLRAAVAVLGASGAKVAIVTAPYRVGLIGDSQYPKDDCVNSINRQVAAESSNATLVDLASYICPTRDTCRLEQDGVTLREDGLHYRGESARIIASWILSQVRLKS
jgi:peptidoglycan/LPS O-acetylase OafA/YrhL